MAKSSFRLALEDAINQRHSAVHPWSEAWTSGKLNRTLLGEWVKQHYHYVSHFSEWLGTTSSVVANNAYHPGNQRNPRAVAEAVSINVATDMGFDVLREFWPEIAHKFKLPFRERPPSK